MLTELPEMRFANADPAVPDEKALEMTPDKKDAAVPEDARAGAELSAPEDTVTGKLAAALDEELPGLPDVELSAPLKAA